MRSRTHGRSYKLCALGGPYRPWYIGNGVRGACGYSLETRELGIL